MEIFVSTNLTATTTLHEEIFSRTTMALEDLEEEAKHNESSFKIDAIHHLEEGQSAGLFYAVLSAIFVLGIFSNSLLILIFILQKSVRTTPNTYIFNLALADLFTVVSCSVAPLLQGAGGRLPVVCKGFQLLLGSCMGVISFTLVALSVERYYAIAKPLHRRVSSKKFTLSIAILTWVVSTSYAIERMVVLSKDKSEVCVVMSDPSSYSHVYTLVDFFALYFGPLVVIAVFHILLAKELYFSDRFVSKDSNNVAIPRHMKTRKRIALTVLILVLMFALFYFPFNFLSLRLYFDSKYLRRWNSSTNILFCVGCLHGCINPLVLYSLSESFRGHFNNYLFYKIFKSPVSVKNEHTACHCVECSKRLSVIKMCSSAV